MTTPPVERRHPPDALIRVVNPVVRRLVARGRLSDQLLLLHYRGRRSGKAYDLPVGHHLVDGRLSVLTNSGWRHNFRGGADVEVTLRGQRRPARATLVDDPEVVASVYEQLFAELGVGAGQRRLGLKVNTGRAPTRAELLEAAGRYGLSIVQVELDPG